MIKRLEIANPDTWNQIVLNFRCSHILQSWEWGKIKNQNGWVAKRIVWKEDDQRVIAAAQILIREIRFAKFLPPIRMAYTPRGPLLDWNDKHLALEILSSLIDFVQYEHAFFVKIDPEAIKSNNPEQPQFEFMQGIFDNWKREFEKNGWRFSHEQVQFPNSVIINLSAGEENILAGMKQKTRYNLRLAEKKGIVINQRGVKDLSTLYNLYDQTSTRDDFLIRNEEYYREVWATMLQTDKAIALTADFENEAVAGLIQFIFGKKSWYFYGMSSALHREKMPNYLLQWEAMRKARQAGCVTYDLWGAPDLENPKDRLWGVYRFKEGFNGYYYQTIGAWDYVINPFIYYLYKMVLPIILELIKKIRPRKGEVLSPTE